MPLSLCSHPTGALYPFFDTLFKLIIFLRSFGAIYYNFCQYTAQSELAGNFSLNPYSNMQILSPSMRTCVDFCSGLYAGAPPILIARLIFAASQFSVYFLSPQSPF